MIDSIAKCNANEHRAKNNSNFDHIAIHFLVLTLINVPTCPHSLVVVCSASIKSLCNGTAHKFSLNNFTRNLSSCISKQIPLSRPSSSHSSVLIYQLYGTQWHPCEGGYRMAQTSKLAQYVFWGRMIYLDDWIASSMAKPNVVYIQCCI